MRLQKRIMYGGFCFADRQVGTAWYTTTNFSDASAISLY
jgi:hypothetical protein